MKRIDRNICTSNKIVYVLIFMLMLILCFLTSCNDDEKETISFKIVCEEGEKIVTLLNDYSCSFDIHFENNKYIHKSKFYLCKDAYDKSEKLGIEYIDYVELSFNRGKNQNGNINLRHYPKELSRWKEFVNNKTLYLRCYYYMGEILHESSNLEHLKDAYKFDGKIYDTYENFKSVMQSSIADVKLYDWNKMFPNQSLPVGVTEHGESTTLFYASGSYQKDISVKIYEKYKKLMPKSESIYAISDYGTDDNIINVNYTLPPINKDKYVFKGYYDEIGGKGNCYIDEKGVWTNIYIEDLVVLYPYYIPAAVNVCYLNSEYELIVLKNDVADVMPNLPQMDNIKGWYIVGTDIKIADSDGTYRPGYELITNEDYQNEIITNSDDFVLKLEYRNE